VAPGASKPHLTSSLVPEETKGTETTAAQAPVSRTAFDLTMAGPSLRLEQAPGEKLKDQPYDLAVDVNSSEEIESELLNQPDIKREKPVDETDALSKGD